MTRTANYAKLFGGLPLLGLLTLTNFGCAAFECKGLWPLYAAKLDERTDVQLSEYRQFNAVLRGPEYNYGELTLALFSDQCPILSAVIARKEADNYKGVSGFKLGELEGRADRDRRRVWIIERETGRVVATVNRDTNVITGLDAEPPVWAKPDEGIVLAASPSDSETPGH